MNKVAAFKVMPITKHWIDSFASTRVTTKDKCWTHVKWREFASVWTKKSVQKKNCA